MKNSKITKYLMLAGVAVIWGLIIYKLIGGGPSADEQPSFYVQEDVQLLEEQKDSFVLMRDVTDPFRMGAQPVRKPIEKVFQPEKAHTQTNASTKPKKIPPVKEKKTRPNVLYLGYIKNTSQEKAIGLFSLNNRIYKVGEKEEFEGFQVKTLFRDSAFVVYQNNELATVYFNKE